MARNTDSAKKSFDGTLFAAAGLVNKDNLYEAHLADCFQTIARGLKDMASAQANTYDLLVEIKQLLQQKPIGGKFTKEELRRMLE